MIAGTKDTTLSEHAKYKEPKVLEALAASGLRAIRYAVEVDGIGEVTAVDNNEAAVEACKKNIQHNGSLASSKVVPHHADARVYMLTHPKEFDVMAVAGKEAGAEPERQKLLIGGAKCSKDMLLGETNQYFY